MTKLVQLLCTYIHIHTLQHLVYTEWNVLLLSIYIQTLPYSQKYRQGK